MSRRVLGSVQPAYLAWVPFFERMKVSDVFVYLDDVEYSKNSFHNRNRIKAPQGAQLLTVPVLYSGNSRAYISQIKIDYAQNWQAKHWKSIQQSYSKAKFYPEIAPRVQDILMRRWDNLAELNVAFAEFFRQYLGIRTPCFRSSQIPVSGTANEKLVNLCRHFRAESFIVKPGTEEYHPPEFFKERGVDFKSFNAQNKVYPQLFGEFVPGLSILDWAMNCGPDSF